MPDPFLIFHQLRFGNLEHRSESPVETFHRGSPLRLWNRKFCPHVQDFSAEVSLRDRTLPAFLRNGCHSTVKPVNGAGIISSKLRGRTRRAKRQLPEIPHNSFIGNVLAGLCPNGRALGSYRDLLYHSGRALMWLRDDRFPLESPIFNGIFGAPNLFLPQGASASLEPRNIIGTSGFDWKVSRGAGA